MTGAGVTALGVGAAAVLGVLVGALVARLAARFPWPPRRSRRAGGDTAAADGESRPGPRDRGGAGRAGSVAVLTGVLFALTAWRIGLSWELPAFLFLAGAAVLLTVVDVQHRVLPNRVVLPSIAVGAVLLTVAAAGTGEWSALLRAGVAAGVLFVVFLFLALISPRSLGMGDVKLAALLGLYLGWVGWGAVVLGAAAGFIVQALLALALLAGRRIGLRAELPFGPAMLIGAAVAIGWPDLLLR
ncbi:A24 family peptidase [Blastococcus jejuensis]|uniref:prepilin peptidase n=1 Tax=Blastococcus jejuensis TaxID=351224 RepID=UPI0031CF6777